jgi:hypothetical protein
VNTSSPETLSAVKAAIGRTDNRLFKSGIHPLDKRRLNELKAPPQAYLKAGLNAAGKEQLFERLADPGATSSQKKSWLGKHLKRGEQSALLARRGNLMNKREVLQTDADYRAELNAMEKATDGVEICAGAPLDVRDPSGCYTRDMLQRLAPALAAMKAGTEACGTKGLQPHQDNLYQVCRAMAKREPKDMGGARGLLCYWSTGSGKTAASLAIVLAFWDSPRSIILATTPENERDNNLSIYAQNLIKYFPHKAAKIFERAPTPMPRPTDGDARLNDWCKDAQNIAGLSNRVSTETFTTLASNMGMPKGSDGIGKANPIGSQYLLGKYGTSGAGGGAAPTGKYARYEGSVLIMDEVQSLFTPAADKYRRACRYVADKLDSDTFRERTMVFALTATPGNNVRDTTQVVNIVRPLGTPPLKPIDALNAPEKFAGMVSYIELSGDRSRFGVKRVKNLYIPMGPRYYTAYLKTISKLTDADLDYKTAQAAKKEASFLTKQRAAGDAVALTATKGAYPEGDVRAFLAGGGRGVPRAVKIGNQTRILSDKLRLAIENATSMPGKQYMYVADIGTAKIVGQVLVKMKFGQVTSRDFAKSGSGARAKYESRITSSSPRFLFYRTGAAMDVARGKAMDQDEKLLKGYKALLADKRNDDGSMVKVIIATGTYYQGFDTRALQGVHIVDQLFNVTADRQAIGRGLRLCGHYGAPSKLVTIYRYFSVPPPGFDVRSVLTKGGKKIEELEALSARLLKIPSRDVDLRGAEGTKPGPIPPGVNSYIFADAIRREVPMAYYQNVLKAYAIDCGLWKDAMHHEEPFQCGVPPGNKPTAAEFEAGAGAASPARSGSARPASPARSGPSGPSGPGGSYDAMSSRGGSYASSGGSYASGGGSYASGGGSYASGGGSYASGGGSYASPSASPTARYRGSPQRAHEMGRYSPRTATAMARADQGTRSGARRHGAIERADMSPSPPRRTGRFSPPRAQGSPRVDRQRSAPATETERHTRLPMDWSQAQAVRSFRPSARPVIDARRVRTGRVKK